MLDPLVLPAAEASKFVKTKSGAEGALVEIDGYVH